MRELVDGRLIGRWPRMVLNALTTAVVAYFLAGAAVALFVSPDLPRLEAVGGGGDSRPALSVSSLNHFSPILTRNVFKAALPEPDASSDAESLASLAVAKINAQLLGTMYSDVAIFSRAVILQGNKQKLVKVGDSLAGFTIAEIQRRAIVLKKGGQRQLLLIDAADKKNIGRTKVSGPQFSRRDIKRQLQDMDGLAEDIRLAVVEHDGKKRFLVRQLRAGSLFSKAGLHKGDVVLKVGGQDVVVKTDPANLFHLLKQERVFVDIVRNGRPTRLVLLMTR